MNTLKLISKILLLIMLSVVLLTGCKTNSEYTYYEDLDNDGHGNSANTISDTSTTAPSGYSSIADDCDDTDPNNYPGNTDSIDGSDNNCNEIIDDSYEYQLSALAFNNTQTVQACVDYGDGSYTLATWRSEADLAAMITLCHTQGSPCFTQYKVDTGAHISIIDSSTMPSYYSYYQGNPLYTINKDIMIRPDLDFLYEHQAAGPAICGKDLTF